MKQYTKTIDGKAVIRTQREIIIVMNGMRTINPTEDMILADGWVEYIPAVETLKEEVEKAEVKKEEYTPLSNTIEIPTPEVSDRAAFVRARHKLRNKIQSYDGSSKVNLFYVQGLPIWLDKVTRAGLLLRFQAEAAQGLVSTSLWYNGTQFPLNVEQAIQMLYAIELYASACYDNTQRHLAAINTLQTIEEIEGYDYTVGYPEKLNF